MIVEGSVILNQCGNKLKLKNHLTANVAKFLFRMLFLSYINVTSNSGIRYGDIYLMKTFKIALGSGTTQVPLSTLTALQSQICEMGGSNTISGDYAIAAPFCAKYTVQITATALCSAFAGVTISTIIQDVIAIQSDPPGSPVTGDKYIVASPATGDWTGNETKVATYNGATWDFVTPDTSYAASVTGTPNVPYRFNGTSWIEIVNRCREMGLFTYGYASLDTYAWSYLNVKAHHGNAYFLAAYISANGGDPDFDINDIDICKSLSIEWAIRISFMGG